MLEATHYGLEVQQNIYKLGEGEEDSNSIRQESSPDVWVKVIHANQSGSETRKLRFPAGLGLSVSACSHHAMHLMNTQRLNVEFSTEQVFL
jgi:hypothetical protein